MAQVGHEVAKQNGEENQAKHLSFCCRLNNVRRHHSLEYCSDIASALTFDSGCNIAYGSVERQQVPRRFAVDVARADHIDNNETEQNCGKRGRSIKQQRPATQFAEVASGADSSNANNNRRDDQRYDDHLQAVEKNGSDVVKNRNDTDAKYFGYCAVNRINVDNKTDKNREYDRD